MKKILLFLSIFSTLLWSECLVPKSIEPLLVKKSLAIVNDYKRNANDLKRLCVHQLAVKEGKYLWNMLLVTHPNVSIGAFWFLPHDNENSAFDAAIYAVKKYGGGFLSIMANDKRYYKNQDPNRNFSLNATKEKSCKHQKTSSHKFTKIITSIIQEYTHDKFPILALHNNKNSWYGGVGQGGVSILNSSKSVYSYKAHKDITSYTKGLKDEDSLVYIAGKNVTPNKSILNDLLKRGLNVKYEIVNRHNNDCSLSNYVILNRPNLGYYNVEAEHGDTQTQKIMIDKLMQHIDRLQSNNILEENR